MNEQNNKYEEIENMYSSRSQTFRVLMPSNLRVLCAILGVKPEELIGDFLWTISYMPGPATLSQRQAAVDYFIERGYGSKMYNEDDIRQMFKELEAKLMLWIDDGENNRHYFEEHCRWRNMYIEYWYRKWFFKSRRKEKLSVLWKY